MKKLIILFLFFSTAFAQQKDTIANATITVGNTTYSNVTIIIPKQSVSGGVSKFQLDSGLAKKQDKLIQGNNISIANSVISATGGGSEGQIINVSGKPYKSFRSPFYQKIYPDGSQQMGWDFASISTHDISTQVRPNVVFNWIHYNMDSLGNKISPIEYAARFGWENYFKDGMGRLTEFHIGGIDYWNNTHRWFSFYMGLDSSILSRLDIEGAQTWTQPNGSGLPQTYATLIPAQFSLTANRVGQAAQISLTSFGGKTAFLSMRGDAPEFSLPANTGLGQNPFYIGYGQVQEGLKNFPDDTTAKANGLRTGSHYMTTVTIGTKTLEVETRVK